MCQGIFFMVFNIFFTRLSRRRHGRAHPPPSPRALRVDFSYPSIKLKTVVCEPSATTPTAQAVGRGPRPE